MELVLGVVICLGTLFVFLVLPVMVLGALANEDYRGIRRLFRERRFGLLSIFLMTAVVAVALALLRGMGVEFTDPAIACLGVIALAAGVVVVGLLWLAFSDRLERGEARKLKDKIRTPDVQVSPPPEIPLAELADEDEP